MCWSNTKQTSSSKWIALSIIYFLRNWFLLMLRCTRANEITVCQWATGSQRFSLDTVVSWIKNISPQINKITKILLKVSLNTHNNPSILMVFYHICSVRHIRIKIIHGSHTVLWVLTWVDRILVFFTSGSEE